MEKLIEVQKLNEDNKIISKKVPENLLSLYINSGWKIVKKVNINEDKPKEEKTKIYK